MSDGIDSGERLGRRRFLGSAVTASGLCLVGCATTSARAPGAEDGDEELITPGEDLMQEHGVLDRVLLIYEEARKRLQANEDLPRDAVAGAAEIVRAFVEDYHEKLEEDHVFPRFRAADQHVELVDVLKEQHDGGRALTDIILRNATAAGLADDDARRRLDDAMHRFIRMYAPHAARENSVLFPAFRRLLSPSEYRELGERFEDEEHRRLGQDGFERYVERVAEIEKTLGIHDLSQFTPNV